MMYKCEDCGNIFDEDELVSWNEDRGEFWGQKVYEKLYGCPYCYSCDYDQFHHYSENDEIESDDDEIEEE